MTSDEWERAEDLARRARTSRTKVLRVALAHLDLAPDEIGEAAWGLNDGRFNGSPAASKVAATSGVDVSEGEVPVG